MGAIWKIDLDIQDADGQGLTRFVGGAYGGTVGEAVTQMLQELNVYNDGGPDSFQITVRYAESR